MNELGIYIEKEQKGKMTPCSHHTKIINSRWNFRKDIIIIIKVLEDNIGEYLHDHGTRKDFLDKTKKALINYNGNSVKLEIKINNICSWYLTIKSENAS